MTAAVQKLITWREGRIQELQQQRNDLALRAATLWADLQTSTRATNDARHSWSIVASDADQLSRRITALQDLEIDP